MASCGECLFQGDKDKKEGEPKVFCLMRGNWAREDSKCEQYRDLANLSIEIRSQYAQTLRQERDENRRLSKVLQKNFKYVIVAFILSFVLFMAAVKFFEKYIF